MIVPVLDPDRVRAVELVAPEVDAPELTAAPEVGAVPDAAVVPVDPTDDDPPTGRTGIVAGVENEGV